MSKVDFEYAPLIQFTLADGRELVARPLIIGNTVNVDHGGHIRLDWDIHEAISGPCLSMFVMLEKPFGSTKIFLPGGVG